MQSICAGAQKKLPMLEVHSFATAGLLEIRPKRFEDDRGFFSETWNAQRFAEAGIKVAFVQDNHSLSVDAGTLRGLHFQTPPLAQAKLVRVTRGSAYDVAVDLRPLSPTYRHWAAVTLSAAEWNQLFIPVGFAHGFLTLEPDTEVQYKTSTAYSPQHDRAIRFDDPEIAIDWPFAAVAPILSDRDRAAAFLAQVETGF
jgi:dTDP-4-dehydrorhamnose 3,5-epimerase